MMFHRLILLIVGWSFAVSMIGYGPATLEAAAPVPDAGDLCQQGGFVQFTPDGERPFADTGECINFAAQQGGANGLIRRVIVSLTDEGKGTTIFADFTVTGLVPERQYFVTITFSPYETDAFPLVFTADAAGFYTGVVTTAAPVVCTGGVRLFVRVTTVSGFLLGTNGTFLPC